MRGEKGEEGGAIILTTYLFGEFGIGRVVANKHHTVVYIYI